MSSKILYADVLMPLPLKDFDPTEAAVAWKILHEGGKKVVFATPDAKIASADPVMVTGKGLGVFKFNLRADKYGRNAYAEMIKDQAYLNPISYEEINIDEYNALVLPGGHAKGIRPYIESSLLQEVVSDFFGKWH